MNRQIRLLQTDEQHKARYEKLTAWVAEKEDYLNTKEEIDTVSKAHLHLRYPSPLPLQYNRCPVHNNSNNNHPLTRRRRLLDAYDKESAALQGTSVSQWDKQGEELLAQKYERSDDVSTR